MTSHAWANKRPEGYKLMGDDQQLDGFLDDMANPPSTGDLRHLDLAGAKRNCDIGLRSMFIYPNGDVFFCDFLGKPIGNVRQNSLEDIYRAGRHCRTTTCSHGSRQHRRSADLQAPHPTAGQGSDLPAHGLKICVLQLACLASTIARANGAQGQAQQFVLLLQV